MTEDRAKIWDAYLKQGGQHHKIVKRMFTDYNRYFEADLILNELFKGRSKVHDLKVLDYGCGAGDYGMVFARNSSQVSFYDFPRATQLVDYRLKREKLTNGVTISADDNDEPNFQDYNLVIFGEVLEHLANPVDILTRCLGIEYIVTSSYPYRTDDKDDPYWSNHDHDDLARIQQPECRELLERNYSYKTLDGQLRLWQKL